MQIPRCMSTQHPDNVKAPFFADKPIIQGETEIQEAYYAYSHLGCREQMWDYEGKEVDNFVVKKLLTRYADFFQAKRLGEDLFLTLRVPNPRVERAEAKVLLETLESIPRSFDTAQPFYGDAKPPIFEVILPMTVSAGELNRIYYYYKEFVGGKERRSFFDVTVGDWVGDFKPDRINVIPLIEDKEHLLQADQIVSEYLQDKELGWQRVFLARSDPALNYGLLPAVLINKIALARLQRLEEETGVELLPILGVGSAPFRGNFNPATVDDSLEEYPSVQTFTIQSAFKYDHEEEKIRRAIKRINERRRERAAAIDEERCREITEKVAKQYGKSVKVLVPIINKVSRYVPSRRARKLHIGLFGYSRKMDGHDEIQLPRAIKFCASLYSLGIPPELLGLSELTTSDLAFVRSVYRKFDRDMRDALRYFNEDNLKWLPQQLQKEIERVLPWFEYDPDEHHREATAHIVAELDHESLPNSRLEEMVVEAASIRNFLG